MDMKQIKELLANADVRQVLEEQIQKAVSETKAELDANKATLAEERAAFKKEAFIYKKTLLAKSTLYENKLKEYYESKFNDAKKKMGKEVYEFVNESIKNLTKSIEEDIKASSPTVKIQEAFSRAIREMAPYININELEGKNQADIDKLTKKLNETIKRNKELESQALVGNLHTLVVSECAGYPTEKIALLYETVKKMEPKSLVEGKEALEAAKVALKEKEAESIKKIEETKVVTEEKKPVAAPVASTQRNKLKVIAETISDAKQDNKNTLEENVNTSLDASISGYDII